MLYSRWATKETGRQLCSVDLQSELSFCYLFDTLLFGLSDTPSFLTCPAYQEKASDDGNMRSPHILSPDLLSLCQIVSTEVRHIIRKLHLRLRNMTTLDATGFHALEQFSDRLHKAGKTLLLCSAREQPSLLVARSDSLKHVGVQNVLPHVQAALTRAREIQGDFSGIGRELALELERRPL